MSENLFKNMAVKDTAQPRMGYVDSFYRAEDGWMVRVKWVMGGTDWVPSGQLQKVEQKAKVQS